MARLALNLAFYTGDPYPDLVHLGQQAEEAGYDCLMVPEGIEGNDSLLCCYMLVTATNRVRVATNVANIYLRDPSLCAVTAATIQQASQGRFILGIGPSHRPVLQAMGIEMGNAREHLRKYTMELRKAFGGARAKNLGVHFPHPGEPVPIYFGALTLETVRMAGELADGLLLVHCTAQRLAQVIRATRESARQFGRRPDEVAVVTSVQAYVHDDVKLAKEAARAGMAIYMGMPYYNRLLRNSGFASEAQSGAAAWERGDKAALAAAASDRLLDAITIYGPASRCRERLSALGQTGVDMIGIIPGAVGGEDPLFSVKRCLSALAPR
ncbi:MAG TPA: LLM class flavin-dependent oxidoreductase [Candidatus Binataceae bacterium]|jgi:alkanesulfonate monooxygenase SsuD/methylene tetrahydromethanopterin reductase-like flavin-dependent oxidoreductase (luciferase family)|nr:LLM class flavin-dependent oxidoreductase [Candidatus Binataceae bacterium]